MIMAWGERKDVKRPYNSPSSFAHVFVVYDESYVIKQLVVDSGKRLICNLRWTIDGPHASASPISTESRENCLLRARRKMLQDSICWKGHSGKRFQVGEANLPTFLVNVTESFHCQISACPTLGVIYYISISQTFQVWHGFRYECQTNQWIVYRMYVSIF